MILKYSIIVFITQVIFIGCRTWNVQAVAKADLKQVLISGGLVHLSWLVSIAIGSVSMHSILQEFQWQQLPIISCSLVGGLIGSWVGLQQKTSKIPPKQYVIEYKHCFECEIETPVGYEGSLAHCKSCGLIH